MAVGCCIGAGDANTNALLAYSAVNPAEAAASIPNHNPFGGLPPTWQLPQHALLPQPQQPTAQTKIIPLPFLSPSAYQAAASQAAALAGGYWAAPSARLQNAANFPARKGIWAVATRKVYIAYQKEWH